MAKRPNPIVQRISLEGADLIEAQLRQLGKAGELAFAGIKRAGGVDLAVGLQKQFAAINKDFRSVSRAFADVGRASATFGRNVSLIGVAIGGAVAGVLAFTKAGTEAVDLAGKQAQALGLMVDEYGRLSHAADQSGVSQEQFTSGMSRLNRVIGDAASGSKSALAAFAQIGVSFRDADGSIRPVEAIVLDLAEAFSRMPEGAQKSALAMELFGRAGAQMIPFLNSGRQGLRQLGEEAARLGLVFSEEQFRIAETFNDALSRVSVAAKGIRASIALAFAPAGTQLVDALTAALVRSRSTLTEIATEIASRVEPVLRDLLNTLTGDDAAVVDRRFLEWRDAVIQFGRDVASVIEGVVVPTFRAIGEAADAAARGINRIFGTDVSGGAVLITVAIGKISGAFALLNATAKLALASIGFLVKHPAIAALLVLSGRMASLAGQQTIAEQAADEHARSLADLDAAMRAVGTASSEARNNLRQEAEASLAAAEAKRELIKASIDEIALANAIRKVGNSVNADLLIAGILDEERKAVEAYVGEQDKLIEGLRHRARELSKADRETVNLAASTNDAAAATEELGEKARKAFPNLAGTATRSVSETLGRIKPVADEAGQAIDSLNENVRRIPQGAEDAARAVEELGEGGGLDNATRLIDAIPDALAEVAPAANEAIAGIGDGATTIAEQIQTAFQDVPGSLLPVWQQIPTDAQTAFSQIAAGAQAARPQLAPPFQASATSIISIFAQMVQTIGEQLRSLIAVANAVASAIAAAMQRAIAAANAARAAVQAAGGGGGGSGFAEGGRVFGPGSATSDSIPAWLSAGEFVVKARAVEHYGPQIFAALNSLRVPRIDIPRFHGGGFVESINHSLAGLRLHTGGLVPAMAGSGGSVRDMGRLTLGIGTNGDFEVEGPVDVLGRFARAVNRQNLTKTGRGPARLR